MHSTYDQILRFFNVAPLSFGRGVIHDGGTNIFSVAAFLDFTGALIVFYIKFAEFRKYAKCVDGDTSIIINKFRGYSIVLGIVVSILFFWPAIIPVILTGSKISDPLKRMTVGLY